MVFCMLQNTPECTSEHPKRQKDPLKFKGIPRSSSAAMFSTSANKFALTPSPYTKNFEIAMCTNNFILKSKHTNCRKKPIEHRLIDLRFCGSNGPSRIKPAGIQSLSMNAEVMLIFYFFPIQTYINVNALHLYYTNS